MPLLHPALVTIWTENDGVDRLTYLFRGIAWQVRRRLGYASLVTLPNGARVRAYPSSSFSGLFYSRWQEKKDVLFLRAHAHVAPNYVDAGAHVGVFAAQVFDKFETFFLFEPAPDNYAALCETCALNAPLDAHTFNVAVSDTDGEDRFCDEGGYSGTSRLLRSHQPADHRVRIVPTVALDSALRDVPGDFVLKVDVEGAEEQVFLGAAGLFDGRRIKLVMFERLGRTNLERALEFFSCRDYIVFYVRSDGSLSRESADIERLFINLFACPAEVWPTLSRPLSPCLRQ